MELNKIYNEDCIKGMESIKSESVDLVVTDPPYLINYKTGRRKDKSHRFNKVILNDNNEQLIIDYINECYRILKNNSAMYMFCSSDKVDFFKQQLEKKFKIKKRVCQHIRKMKWINSSVSSVQFISVTQSCLTLCDPMNCSTPGLPVHHQLPEFTQTHVHRVSDAIQPSHPLSSPSPPAPNPSQHQSLFQ